MIRAIVISNMISCLYTVLTVFAWISSANQEGVLRAAWWIFTIIFAFIGIVCFFLWLPKEGGKS